MAITGALVALMVCGGVWLAFAGLVGVRESDRPLPEVDWRGLWWKVGLAVVVFGVVWAVTGWPMAGVSAAAIAVMVPVLLEARSERDRQIERADALASWAEMLRDTIASHAGLNQAVTLTAKVAPAAIAPELRALSLRCERMPLSDALRLFAADVDDAVADLIVAALTIADQHQSQNLPALLSDIAASSRERSSMRLRVETGRARSYASVRMIMLITFGVAVGMIVFSRDYLDPLGTVWGQVVLAMIGALFTGAVWSLLVMSRPVPEPRLLAGVEDQTL